MPLNPLTTQEMAAAQAIAWNEYKDHPAAGNYEQAMPKKDGPTTNDASKTIMPGVGDFGRALTSNETITNMELLFNDSAQFFRQQLLARGPVSGTSFLVDYKKDIDDECGYPRWITPWQYKYMYDREGLASRVNDLMPNECWAVLPKVYETEDDEEDTEFEQSWDDLQERKDLLHYLKRADQQSGIGYYGIVLLGLNDANNTNLALPVAGIDPRTGEPLKYELDPAGKPTTKKASPMNLDLLYLRVFDETQVRILSYESDTNSPRHAQPNMYYVRFINIARGETGAIAGTVTAHVHWTRILHLADGRGGDETFGTPRLQNVYNRIYDLRKILSASGEMFWKGGFPGFSFEVNPEIAAEAAFDEEAVRDEFERYSNGLQRYLALKGLTVKSLATQVSSPKEHFETQVRAICASKGFPIRVFLGTEEQQRTTSTEEAKTWNKHVAARQEDYLSPKVVRPFINMLIKYGILKAPKKRYTVYWPDLNTTSDADLANLAFKRAQALGQYINAFIYHIFPLKPFYVMVLGYTPAEADAIIKVGGGEKKMLASLKEMYSIQANSMDGGVQQKNRSVKSGGTASDKLKKSGKKTEEGSRKKIVKNEEGSADDATGDDEEEGLE